jgi:hypothetical protein
MSVEYVDKVPGFDWLTCVIVNSGFVSPDRGDVLVRLEVRNIRSNRVRLGLGRIGVDFRTIPGVYQLPVANRDASVASKLNHRATRMGDPHPVITMLSR